MGKGVLLELNGRQAVVLTPQGEFKRVPAPGGSWDIGDEIEFAEIRQAPWAKWGLVAAAAVMLLVAPVGYQTYALAQPVAIVTVDINPSVQLTLNKKDQVLRVDALNQDGSLVIDGIDYRRQPVGEVVAEIAAKAVDARKLNVADDAGAVVVAVAPAKRKDLPKNQADRIRDAAYSAVTTVVQEAAREQGVEVKANVLAIEATAAEKAEAEQIGITPGKLITGKEIQQVAPQVQLEDLQEIGPGKLLKSLNINAGDVFSEAGKAHEGKSSGRGKGSEDSQQARPAVTQPSQTPQPGEAGKGDDNGKSGDKQPGQTDDKGGTSDDKQQPKSNGASDQGSGSPSKDNGKEGDRTSPGQSKDREDKGNSGSTVQPGNKNNNDSKGSDKDKQEKGSEKKGSDQSDTWNFFGWKIEKPAFLRGKDDAPATSEENPPQANAPGVGAPPETAAVPGTGSSAPAGSGRADREDPSAQVTPNDPEGNQPEAGQEKVQPGKDRPETEQPETKKGGQDSEDKDRGHGSDQKNQPDQQENSGKKEKGKN